MYFTKFYRAFNEPNPASPPASPPVSPPPPPPPPTTFTQEQVNAMMAENKRNLQKKNEELVAQLEEQKKTSGLTVEQKEALEARIETLSKEHLTKEQQQLSEHEKFKKKYDADTKALTEEKAKWESEFKSTLVKTALVTAAAKHSAHSPDQILMMFQSQVKVVEATDAEGNKIGGYTTKLPVTVVDPKTKQPVVLELGVEEAIGKIRENESFQNLFVDTSKGGIGGSGNRPGQSGDAGAPPTDPGAYRAWRQKTNLKT